MASITENTDSLSIDMLPSAVPALQMPQEALNQLQ
jgi:hypothetical protein